MVFNKWCEKRDYLLKVSNYTGNTDEYFKRLKSKINDLGLNDGLRVIYAKRNGPNELEELFFFYSDKLSVILLNGMEITVRSFRFSDIQNVEFKFILNSDYQESLKLIFNNESFTLNPIEDTESSEYQDYLSRLKEIYFIVK